MIDNSYLLGLFGGTTLTSSGTTGAAVAATRKKQPTPPWSAGAVAAPVDERLRAALAGRRLIDLDAVKPDAPDASGDYRRLFALHQGLDTLTALASRAQTKGASATELSLLSRRFDAGLAELSAWLPAQDFQDVRLVQGTTAAMSKTTAAVRRDSAVSVGAPIHEGGPDQVVAAFQGAVAFTITVRAGEGASEVTTPVAIDLADMGAAPRTLDAVLAHVNQKLADAGLQTRLGREKTVDPPRAVTVNGKAVALPAAPDRWALAVRGAASERVTFSEPAPVDAVCVVQSTAGGGHEVLKFAPDRTGAARVGETQWVDGRLSQTRLPDGVAAVRASVAADDGGMWLVVDLDAAVGGQPVKGAADVALMRLDSAGRVVTTRALGAASQAQGFSLAVAADGKLAVAGSVTGGLEPGASLQSQSLSDSFVTVFDPTGQELWTQRRGARAEDQATSVAFAADGTVVVSGRARSALSGATAQGGWDGYVQTFRAAQPYPGAAWTAAPAGALQFGTSGEDSAAVVAVSGQEVHSAGVENGRLVVRRFTLDAQGRPVLAATRDMGLAGGAPTGLAVQDGRVILSGTTHNAALDAGTVTRPHSGGTDAFVAVLDADLVASPADRLTYLGGAGHDTVADMKVHDGKVWITGTANRPVDAKETDPVRAYLTRLDPLTGVVEWTRDWSGDGGQARAATLSVAPAAAGVLDRLGLPQGEIVQADSKRLVDATALRVGDRFHVSPPDGGRPVAVTVDARDTLQTLARKIEGASLGRLKVTVASEAAKADGDPGMEAVFAGLQRLSITARDGRGGAVLTAGEPGRDALAGLGLSAGFIGPTAGEGEAKTFGLNLPRTLTLSDAAQAKAAGERLQAAMKAVRDAYRALNPATTPTAGSGTVPAYLQTQLANYQAALARLGG